MPSLGEGAGAVPVAAPSVAVELPEDGAPSPSPERRRAPVAPPAAAAPDPATASALAVEAPEATVAAEADAAAAGHAVQERRLEASAPALGSVAVRQQSQTEAHGEMDAQAVLEAYGVPDGMLSCRILLHLMEGVAGSCTCLVLLSSSVLLRHSTNYGRWFFVLLMLGVSGSKAAFSLHMAYRFSGVRRGGDFGSHAATLQALWRRSVRLFPALSMIMCGCYLLSACFSIVEVSSGEASLQAGHSSHLLFLNLSLFLYSALLFLESYTAPKRATSMTETTVAQRKVELPAPPPSGRIRTGRYGKLMGAASPTECGTTFSTCAICLDCFQAADDAARLPCGHIFHSDCLREWLRVRLQCPFRCAVSLGGMRASPALATELRNPNPTRHAELARGRRLHGDAEDMAYADRAARELPWRGPAAQQDAELWNDIV